MRHIFPIHNFDNAFGTPAAWQDAINVGNIAAKAIGGMSSTAPIRAMGSIGSDSDSGLYLLGFGGDSLPMYPKFTSGSCHQLPVSPTSGSILNPAGHEYGLIIDVDHMSINAFNDTIDLVNHQTPVYAGIAATHVQFFDLYLQNYPGTGVTGVMSACELTRTAEVRRRVE